MKFTENVLLMKVEKFDFKAKDTGQQIIAFVARVLFGGVVYKCKIKESLYEDLKDVVDRKGQADFELNSYKELVKLELVNFV